MMTQAGPLAPWAAPARPDEETRTELIAWMKAFRDGNREDEVLAAQHARLDLARLEGRAGLDETLVACEAVQESGQRMIESLRAMTPPAGLPPGDVRALRLAVENSALFYRHQAKWMEHQHGLLTELRPYGGQFSAIPAEVFGEVAPRLYEHLHAIQPCQRLALDALNQVTAAFTQVVERWGILNDVADWG